MKRLLLFLAVAAAGCLPRTPGELSNGGFTYFCASDLDLACQDDFFDASDVPAAIAVGAHFDLRFTAGGQSVASLAPTSPELLETEASTDVDSTGFRFVAPGTVAVLARSGDTVLDFLHVTGASIQKVAVVDETGSQIQALTLALSDSFTTLKALPVDDAQRTLAGALSCTWETSDDQVVSVSPESPPNQATLTPRMPGTAIVTVTIGDQKTLVSVTVKEAP